MKFATSLAAIALAVLASTAEAVVSPGCTAYLETLSKAPLAQCRVYTAIGFPGITGKADHDTVKLQKAIDTYCGTPACPQSQYDEVFAGLKTNCAADMIPANQATLGTTLYMWYLSPAQREAVCFKNEAKTGSCVVDSVKEMIDRAQLPNANPNEDDLYGYLQYVTPMLSSRGITASGNKTIEQSFCTPCNQQVANIFSNYFTKSPSTFELNFDQKLDSKALNTDLTYQYKTSCKVELGKPMDGFKTVNATDAAKDKKDPASAAVAVQGSGAVFAAIAAFAGVVALY